MRYAGRLEATESESDHARFSSCRLDPRQPKRSIVVRVISAVGAVSPIGGEPDDQDAVRRIHRRQALHRAVIEHLSLIDQDDPAAQAFDVHEIVSREDHGRPTIAIDLFYEGADPLLGDDVESHGRLIEVNDPRIVEQRRREITAHPLAKAQLANRRVNVFIEIEELSETPEVAAVPIRGDPIHLGNEIERLD